MNSDTIAGIIGVSSFLIFVFGFIGCCLLAEKMEKNHELKKLGILKPKNQNTKIETDYNAKLKYQIKFWIINISALIIICLICKLFGFGIDKVIDLIK